MREWLLRCSACRTVFASMAVPEGQQAMWEGAEGLFPCHPSPPGSPGIEVVLRDDDPLKEVRRWMGVETEPDVRAQVVFKFHDGKQMWWIRGAE